MFSLSDVSFCREKYLNTLLQVEVMLKLWFPHIPTQPVSAASSIAASPARPLEDTSSSVPPHKHRDQLHIPVKVRKRACSSVLVHPFSPTTHPFPSTVLSHMFPALANYSVVHFLEA